VSTRGNRVAAGVVMLWALASGAFASVELILTKDDRTFWAENARTNDTAVLFVDNESKNETNLPLSEVEFILPTVEKGKTYTEEEVKTNLKKIAEARKGHGTLLKQWRILQDQWELVLRVDSAKLNAKIDAAMAKFQAGNKDSQAYRDAMLTLGMLGFKDTTSTTTKSATEKNTTNKDASESTTKKATGTTTHKTT